MRAVIHGIIFLQFLFVIFAITLIKCVNLVNVLKDFFYFETIVTFI